MFSKIRTATAAARVFFHPEDTEQVFVLLDGMLCEEKIEELTAALQQYPRGAAALEQRPTLGKIDVEALSALPEGTLGRVFADFLQERGLDPALLTDEAAGKDRYVIRHLFETHDIWHVVTGMDSNTAGELGLQAFYMAQLPGSAGAMLIALGLMRSALSSQDEQREMISSISRGWQLGRTAEPLAGVSWAELWETPLDEIRASLKLDVAA